MSKNLIIQAKNTNKYQLIYYWTLSQFSLFTIELSVKHIDRLYEQSLCLWRRLDALKPFITKAFKGIKHVSSSGMSTVLYFSNSSLILYKFNYFLVSSSSFMIFFMISSIGICTLSSLFLFFIFFALTANFIVDIVSL